MACPFRFDEKILQIICEICGIAVLPNRLNEHLREIKVHSEVPSMIRHGWVESYKDVKTAEPERAAKQPDGREEITGLRTVECFRCQDCVSRFSSNKTLRVHRSKKHNAKETAGRPQKTSVRSNDGDGGSKLWMQSVFGTRSPHHHYFLVNRARFVRERLAPEIADDETPENLATDRVDRSVARKLMQEGISEMFARAATQREKDRSRAATVDGKETQTPWMKTTGWVEHLKGLNLDELIVASALPGRRSTEEELLSVCSAVRSMFAKANVDLNRLGRDMRQWWRSPKPDEFSYRPLETLGSTAAFDRYIGYWQRLIVYCWRVHELPEVEGNAKHKLTFDAETEEWIQCVKETARSRTTTEEQLRWKEENLESRVFYLSVAILKRKFLDRGWNNPLVHFTSILGIDERSSRLKEPEDYTTILAGLIYCSRLILLRECSETLNFEIEWRPELKEADRIDFTVGHFQEYRRTWLTNGSFTPVSLMLNNLAYGMKRAALVPGRAHVLWVDSDTKTELKFEGRSITRSGLKLMVHELLRETTDSLWRDLLFLEDDGRRFSVDLTTVDDNIALGSRATSGAFLNLNRTTETAAGSELVRCNLFANSKAKEQMLDSKAIVEDDFRSVFRDSGLKRYRKSVDRFLSRLFVLVHVTGGAPARGSEIGCLRYRDGVSVDRNLFTIGGKVIFISQYHKNLIVTDRLKVVPRVLPKVVGDLVVLYLRYVRSFVDDLDAIYKTEKPETDYLWETDRGDFWGTNRMSRALEDATEAYLGVKLTLRSYRHVAVAFSRDVVHRNRSANERFKDFRNEDSLLDEDADDREPDDGDDGESAQTIAALQTGHGLRSRLNHYGQAVNLTAKLTSNSLELFAQVSEEWHRFLGIEEEKGSDDKKHRRQRSSINFTDDRKQVDGLRVLTAKRSRSHTNLDRTTSTTSTSVPGREDRDLESKAYRLLKDKFGYTGFKSQEQLEGTLCVLDKRPTTVVVLPTGGGKSLLWMLPAMADERGMTAVIVPYISLATDLIERCSEIGLKAERWKPHSQPWDCQVVVATTDHAVGSVSEDIPYHQTFLQYLSILRVNNSLNRIVIDECHTVVTENGFRPAMSQVFHLNSLEVPLVFTTATLPPRMVGDFEDVLTLTGCPVRYIRAQSLRPNISVTVRRCGNGRALTAAVELAKKASEKLEPGQKIVLYTRWKNQMSILAGSKLLDCQQYHGEMTDDERRQSLKEWARPEQTFLVATTAFGCGIDHPGIVLVIHVNSPYSMINYVQESGRAGRRVADARSIIVLEDREVTSTSQYGPIANLKFGDYDREYLRLMIQSTKCRLLTITRFLNGGPSQDCTELSANECDNCRTVDVLRSEIVVDSSRTEAVVSSRIEAVRSKVKSTSTGLDRIRETLDWLNSDCAACLLIDTKRAHDSEHRLIWCNLTEGLGFEEIVQFSRSIKWPGNWGYCWTCALPEEICEEAEKKRENRGTCKYKWLIVTVAAYGRLENGFGLRTKALIGISDWKDFDYAGWLGRKNDRTLYNIRTTNAFALFNLFSTVYLNS
ncbi:uncharacterized protein DFL_001416 [Arthrobotrys flagrans]|uniref:DNA 3'-5' helicase n=1 Tax=Arthrobotrys flagrans TaxID=97331 RepID=A0A437A159_ARTFL|nr:hypothetical protein DFL_005412 [Arthrobotrys flagrans]RVD84803.1 hypothetical protein DFL_006526 [Arthrobotrys flagrans]RVD88973.1 hypothetical protein DFL_003136 [Arthrobotrys flagrans]RVD90451.1 hypothetical protein DFL_001416 [Arthrobotrys flagrans]